MSTDASLFPVPFFECNIFCEKCLEVKKFKVFSQETYNKVYNKNEIPPNKPLFCKCEECSNTVIYATNEFAELQENANLGLCKIWGTGNLEAGDFVFLENENLCIVESVNRVRDSLPQATLRNRNKEKIEIEIDFRETDESSNKLYRLIPQDALNARIGDLIYHTEEKLSGEVTGLEFNGGQRLVVKFENNDIVKINVENDIHYLTDNTLEQNAMWRCKNLPYFQNVQVNSNSKILTINCTLPNLKAIYELEEIVSTIPQARCFIMHIAMENSKINSNDIYKELVKNCLYICNCRVEYKNQSVFITGFYSDANIPENIHKILLKFPIKKINLSLKKRSDIKNCKTINTSDAFIRISKIGNETHIDGWVKNEKEKSKAKWKAIKSTFFSSFSFKVEDHLLIIS
ncbi:MAG: hypothetical protein LBC85_07440 [Fibromonadaceae bacterium]|nr:hypothetical protein [Fibromonadaceae bacterium]